MPDVITFYRTSYQYGCFSNFAAYPIQLGGTVWPTSEHYFQGQKFDDPEHIEAIRQAKSPMVAGRMGRDRSKKFREDWETIKVTVMTAAVRAKFTQHSDLRSMLLKPAMRRSWNIRRTTTIGVAVATAAGRTCSGRF